jgi:uncharacterized phiE125 gp8 family phage protein
MSAPRIVLTTSPVPIVTVEDVREHLKLHNAVPEATLETWIAAATRQAENWCGRRLTAGSYVAYFDEFPCDGYGLSIPHSPVLTVTAITYLDASAVAQTWAAENYVVDAIDAAFGPQIFLADGSSWPTPYVRPDAVRVAFTADTPPEAKPAILMLIGALDQVRENATWSPQPYTNTRAAESLLNPYRVMSA